MSSDPATVSERRPPFALGLARHLAAAARTRLQTANEIALVGILLVLCVAIGVKNPEFWSSSNLENVARSTSFTLIVAVAMTLVLVSGSLDLSVGSVFALGGAVAGLAMTGDVPVVPAIFLGLLAGAAAGVVNGLVVEWLRVPALVMTIGMLFAVRGLVLVITGGAPVFPLPESFTAFGQGKLAGIPNPVWIALAVVVAGHVTLTRSVFGRRVHAVGSNEIAAHLAGVSIRRIRLTVFVLSGLAAALAGMLVAGRIESAQTNAGTGLELQVIAAVVIGGTSLFGGSGTVFGTVLGTLLIAVISNGIVLAQVNPFYQDIVIGTIIVAAVAIDGWRRRRLADR